MKYSIREFRREDTADLARAANYSQIADNLSDEFPHPYLFSDAAEFIRSSLENDNPIVRAICADDRVIGCIALKRGHDIKSHSAELGYFVTPAYRGRGIVPQAIKEMCDVYLNGTDLDRIYATPYAWNHASQSVLDKAGFTRESIMRSAARKNGETVDLVVYARTAPRSDEEAQA